MVKYVKFAVEKGEAGQTLAGDPLSVLPCLALLT